MKISNIQASTSLSFDISLSATGWEPVREYNEGMKYVVDPDTGKREYVSEKSKRKFQVETISLRVYGGDLKPGTLPNLSITLRGHWEKKDRKGWFQDTAWLNGLSIDDLPKPYARALIEKLRDLAEGSIVSSTAIYEIALNTVGPAQQEEVA